jgi:DNA (cytosine-5)-methyltransferase 1
MISLTIGSLFSGVGLLELGLEEAGLGPVVYQVESEPFCRRVLAKHWPHALRFDDVREVGAHNLPYVDVLCGGFPCQGLSVAGKRLGLADPRSGLWSEYARIVRETKPRFVVVENVARLAARGLDQVVGDFERAGYAVEGRIIAARDVGAPHKRERLFLVAHARDERRPRLTPIDGTHEAVDEQPGHDAPRRGD